MNSQRWNLWINGHWQEAKEYETLRAPYSGDVIAEIGQATPADVTQAIENAHTVFQSFKNTPAHQRADILYKLTNILEARKEEAAQIIALEASKPIRAARGEMERTIETYRFAAEAAKNIYGDQIPMDAARGGENRLGFTIRMPLGVVSAITPFNFPFNLVAHKVGPAIAAGNTIVLKPAEQTPLSSLFLAEAFQEAGLPDGVLNILPGKGAVLSGALTTHPLVKKVTFTGSPEVGLLIQNQAGFRKVTLELGSNSALIVDEGTDIEKIIDRCVEGAFAYNGQVCISLQRVYVHESLYTEFVQRFTDRTKQLKLGSPLDETTDVTAVISQKSLDRITNWLTEATAAGAIIQCGGTTQGQALLPTVLTNADPQSKIVREEVFGPVVSIFPFRTLQEAILAVNDSRYGLNAGIFTPHIDRAFYAAREFETGGVIINDIPTFRVDQMPYGGVKDSGKGREGIRYAVEEMTTPKFISIRMGNLES